MPESRRPSVPKAIVILGRAVAALLVLGALVAAWAWLRPWLIAAVVVAVVVWLARRVPRWFGGRSQPRS